MSEVEQERLIISINIVSVKLSREFDFEWREATNAWPILDFVELEHSIESFRLSSKVCIHPSVNRSSIDETSFV